MPCRHLLRHPYVHLPIPEGLPFSCCSLQANPCVNTVRWDIAALHSTSYGYGNSCHCEPNWVADIHHTLYSMLQTLPILDVGLSMSKVLEYIGQRYLRFLGAPLLYTSGSKCNPSLKVQACSQTNTDHQWLLTNGSSSFKSTIPN